MRWNWIRDCGKSVDKVRFPHSQLANTMAVIRASDMEMCVASFNSGPTVHLIIPLRTEFYYLKSAKLIPILVFKLNDFVSILHR